MPRPDLNNPIVPDFDLIIGGEPLPVEARTKVVSLVVDDSVDLPTMFEFKIIQSARWLDEETFAIGKEVQVKMGYNGDLATLLKGEITALEPEFFSTRETQITVRGYDRLHRLLRERKTRTFLRRRDSEIASQIAFDAGLTARVEDSRIPRDYVIQANQTDLDFLRERARLVNFEIAIDDWNLKFRPVGNNNTDVLELSFDDFLVEFFPRLSAFGQVGAVNVRGWNPKAKKEVVGKSRPLGGDSTMGGSLPGSFVAERAFGSALYTLTSQPVMEVAEAQGIADARLSQRGLGFVTGDGVCLGLTDLRAGIVIIIKSIGTRFSGPYYVTSAAHRLDERNGYRTHFSVKRNAS
jgi:phage protein D